MSTSFPQNEQNINKTESILEQNNLASSKSRMTSGNGVPSNKPPLSLSRNQFANSRVLSNRNSTKRRWRLYPRGLYPIAEATESQKDEEFLTNEKEKLLSGSPASLSLNHLNIRKDSKTSPKPVKNCNIVSSYNLHGLNILSNTNSYDKNKNNTTKAVVSTSNYSACQKLVEDFQRSVTEDAVKVIQSHYRRFKLRREFLRITSAVKTIQRYVRQWMQQKHQKDTEMHDVLDEIALQDVDNNFPNTESCSDCKVKQTSADIDVAELAENGSDSSSGLGVDIESSIESSLSSSSSGFVCGSINAQKPEGTDYELKDCILDEDHQVPINKRDNLNEWLSSLDLTVRQAPPLVEEECTDIWSDDEYLETVYSP